MPISVWRSRRFEDTLPRRLSGREGRRLHMHRKTACVTQRAASLRSRRHWQDNRGSLHAEGTAGWMEGAHMTVSALAVAASDNPSRSLASDMSSSTCSSQSPHRKHQKVACFPSSLAVAQK
eukprot:3221011-Rhodomonas_salina.4